MTQDNTDPNEPRHILNQIERAKQEWEVTVDSLPHLICLLDKQGRILRANRTVESWDLSPVHKVKGQALHQLFHSRCDDPDCYFEAYWPRMWDLITNQTAEFEIEDRLLKRYFRFQIRPITTDTRRRGKLGEVFAVVIVEDITEQKLVSLALSDAQIQIRSLFENTPCGIALTTFEGAFLAANRGLSGITGYTEAELLQRNVTELYVDPGQRTILLKQLQESGVVNNFGVESFRKDGSLFFANLNVSRLTQAGEDVLLAIIEDVTDQIMAEQQAAALDERERLSRDLHDSVTQTLYSAGMIVNATQRRWAEDRTLEQHDFELLAVLVRGALAEMRALLLELRPDVIKNQSLGQLLELLADAARARTPAEVSLKVAGDRQLPQDVTRNLHRIAQESLNNAAKYADASQVTVELRCDPTSVQLCVKDDGRGFDPQAIPAGHLGLRIMRERAKEIGARIEIDSKPGGGTAVVVTWSEVRGGE